MDKQGKLKVGNVIRGYYLFPILVGVVGLLLSIALYFVNLKAALLATAVYVVVLIASIIFVNIYVWNFPFFLLFYF